MSQLRSDITKITTSVPVGAVGRDKRTLYNSKEFIPEKLGSGYKDAWRSWAYKARDWFSQFDASLPAKLERVESMTGALDEQALRDLDISEETNRTIKRS